MLIAEVCAVAEIEPELYWTPERVDSVVRRYAELQARAESPSLPVIEASGYQPPKGKKSDRHFASVLIADIDKARLVLRPYGAQWLIVDYRCRGFTFEQIGGSLQRSKQSVWEQYQKAIIRMAEALGWREVRDGE